MSSILIHLAMGAVKVKIGLFVLTTVAIMAYTYSLVHGMRGPCILVPQLCDMGNAEFDSIFEMCKESSEGRNVPAHGAECCKMLKSLSCHCLCKGFGVHLSILPPDYDLTAPLQLPHKCGFPLDPPGCRCGRYLFPA